MLHVEHNTPLTDTDKFVQKAQQRSKMSTSSCARGELSSQQLAQKQGSSNTSFDPKHRVLDHARHNTYFANSCADPARASSLHARSQAQQPRKAQLHGACEALLGRQLLQRRHAVETHVRHEVGHLRTGRRGGQ